MHLASSLGMPIKKLKFLVSWTDPFSLAGKGKIRFFPWSRDLTAGALCPPTLTLPLGGGRCEKIDLLLFHVIPAKAGIQCFQSLTT